MRRKTIMLRWRFTRRKYVCLDDRPDLGASAFLLAKRAKKGNDAPLLLQHHGRPIPESGEGYRRGLALRRRRGAERGGWLGAGHHAARNPRTDPDLDGNRHR